jgi:hypothetical protein
MLIRCEGCGASLDAAEHEVRIACRFCGATSLVPRESIPQPPPPPVHVWRAPMPPVHPHPKPTSPLLVLGIIGLVVVSLIGIGLRAAISGASKPPRPASATTAKPAVTPPKPTTKYPAYWRCANNDECEDGHRCVGFTCKPSCEADGDCERGGKCFPVLRDGKPQPDVRVCTAACDLMDPRQVCGPGVNCTSDTEKKSTDCFGKSGKGSGVGACTADNPDSCLVGFTCVRTGESRRCARWCVLGKKDHGCPHGEQCTSLTNAPLLDGVTYGVCGTVTKAATTPKKPAPKAAAPKAAPAPAPAAAPIKL